MRLRNSLVPLEPEDCRLSKRGSIVASKVEKRLTEEKHTKIKLKMTMENSR